MKKFLLFLFLSFIGYANAQIVTQTQNQVIDFCKKQILKRDTTEFNYFISKEKLKANSQISTYSKPLFTPSYESWLFFVDEHPFQSWAHDCKYIFVDEKGKYEIIDHKMPPQNDFLMPVNILKIENDLVKEKPKSSSKSSICTTTDDWAVIINGGMDYINNHERYWNHISAIYETLLNEYHYLENHIIVLNSDGTSTGIDRHMNNGSYTSSPLDLDGDSDNDINFSATHANIHTVFEMLSDSVGTDDDLFIYTTDHGGQTSGNDVFLVLWGETITDDEFAEEVDLVSAANIIITMVQCSSGGFVGELANTNRIITTSCTASQSASSASPYNYSEFTYDWISAVAGERPDNQNIVDADTDNDGYTSIYEAFVYARDNDAFISTETPQYSSDPSSLGEQLTLNGEIPSLTGDNLVCSSNKTFTFNYLPTGGTITWTKSSNLSYVSSTSTSYTVVSNSNGAGWIQASISVGTCDPLILRKDVWVGTPAPSVTGPTEGSVGNSYPYYVNTTPEMMAYYNVHDWSLSPYYDGNAIYDYDYWANAGFYAQQEGYFQICSTAQNACGVGYGTEYIWIYYYGDYSIAPNPASTEVTIAVTKSSQDLVSSSDIHKVSIYNLNGILQSQHKYSGDSFTVPVYNLNDGSYIVKIDNGKTVVNKRLIIKH